MKRVLILHGSSPVSRATTLSQLRALGRAPGAEVHYHHLSAPVTADLRTYPFDGIIINYCFIMQRQAGYQERLVAQFDWLRDHPAVKIALPMDDCYRSAFIEDWCERLGVSVIYTPLYENKTKIYPNISSAIDIRPALTGYVDEEQLPLLVAAAKNWDEREIHVGTRVARSPYSHGRYAILKADYAENFARVGPTYGLTCDISTRPEDALVGADWYGFLGNCRATIGMKGGYGLVDPRGDLFAASRKFLSENPKATYDEVAAACFIGHDHMAEYSCISPRIFECAATRTVQIMPPSNYLECLSPWTHYIPLSFDFSDLDDAIEALADEKLCGQITEECFHSLIETKWFTHDELVRDIFAIIPSSKAAAMGKLKLKKYAEVIGGVTRLRDQIHPILQVSLAHIFMYAQLHGAEHHLVAFVQYVSRQDRFILPSADGDPELAKLESDWFAASYIGQVNLLRGLGVLPKLIAALTNVLDSDYGPLSYWNWAFAGSEPEIRATSEVYPTELHMFAARGQYDELARGAASFGGGPYRTACLSALFAWSRGDYASAKSVGLDALGQRGVPKGPEEMVAADGIAAALLAMMTRVKDDEGLERLAAAKANLTDEHLTDAIARPFEIAN